jgi:catechol 2,3-dioxygenase-like lactoylglutathione lyase family enzyme
VASARRWSVSGGRTVISTVLAVVAAFLLFVSLGAGSWVLAALGAAILAAAAAFYIVAALNSREFAYVPGTAHVVSSSPPPAAASQGRCEMHLVVHAPGINDVAVKIRDAGVPVSKWPDAGATLPILVAVGDPRRVRVLWDSVRSHGEVAEGRDHDYAGATDQESYLGDLLDEEYDDTTLAGLDPDARVIEMDLIGPGYSPSIGYDPDTGMDPDVNLSHETAMAGPDPDVVIETNHEDEEPPPEPEPEPEVRRRPRPSPRPRRPPDDQIPSREPEPETGGGVRTLPELVVEIPEPAAPPEREGAAPLLRVEQLLPADPAVPAMPESPTGDEDVSDAYLSVTRPPGVRQARVRGVGVTLFVSNLGRSLAFYRDLLGFRQVDLGLGSAVLEAGDGRVVLRRVVDMPPVDRRLVHLLLEVPDVQAAYDELLLQGVEFVHRPRPVSRYEQLQLWSAAFRDPDGHGIALTRWDVRT